MRVTVADLRILVLEEQHSMDRAEGLAWARKADAFGTLTKLFSRPRDEDFELVHKERRYQPFWYVVGSALYEYERRAQYQVTLQGPEVRSVTIDGNDYDVTGASITLNGLEHCSETSRVELYVDGLTSTRNPELVEYINYPTRTVGPEDLGVMSAEGAIVVPPQLASTGIVREVVNGLVRRVVADDVVGEVLDIERLDLYFRPVYAFRYRWLSKDREATMEYDALTGKFSADGQTFESYAGQAIEPDLLAPVDAQTVQQLVPGGELAVRVEPPKKR